MADFRGRTDRRGAVCPPLVPLPPAAAAPVPLGRLVKDMDTGRLGLVRETQGGKVRLLGTGGTGSWWCPRYRLALASPDERRALGLDPEGGAR